MRHSAQHIVAGEMAISIVEEFEIVQIHHHDGKRRRMLARLQQNGVQFLLHGAMIEQFGDRIAVGAATGFLIQARVLQSGARFNGHAID